MKARHLDIGLIIIILLITVPSAIIGARESGILYPWFVGRCFTGAYYDSTSFNDPVKGVRVKIAYFTHVGYIHLVLDEDTETVMNIKFVPPGPY